LRLDENSAYGLDFTPRLSLMHHLPRKQSLRLSYGTSFRNPTIQDTYFDLTNPIGPNLTQHLMGNTGLKPEKVTNYEDRLS